MLTGLKDKFSSLAERISLISNPTAVIGEIYIMATSKVLKRSISVSDTHRDTVFKFGEDVFPNETQFMSSTLHYEKEKILGSSNLSL